MVTASDGPRRWARWRRWSAVALVMVALIVGLPVVVYETSVQPGAMLVKAGFEAGTEPRPSPGVVALEDGVSVDVGVPVPVSGAPAATVDVYTSPDVEVPVPVILWLHGGGFIANDSWFVHEYAAMLARAGYVVASLDYALAPEARYPTPVVQADAALAFLLAAAGTYGGDPERIVIGGDSAGAQSASPVAAIETDPAIASQIGIAPALHGQLRAVVLFCGLYDMATVADTGFPALRTFLWSYTGQRDWQRFERIDELSTTRTASAAYPPTFITVGDGDPFASQGQELADALAARGVEVATRFRDGSALGLPHEYQFDLDLPASQTTLAQVIGFLAEHTGETAGDAS